MRPCVCLALICVLLPAACGLKCLTCWGAHPGTCNQVWDCPSQFDRCSTTSVAESLVTKESMRSDMSSRVDSVGSGAAPRICGTERVFFPPLLVAPAAIITLMI